MKEIEASVLSIIPSGCELAKVEVEGPQVVIYLKNVKAFYEDENLITKIASKLRKKVLVRGDVSILQPQEKALAIIKEIVPPEAGVKDVRFDPNFHEVLIEAAKPGLVIGKGGSVLKMIILQTGWSPKVLRVPTMPSETITAVRSALLSQSEQRKKFLLQLGKKLYTPGKPTEWVKITGLGGFREIGRSCLLLQTPSSNVLLDCGLNVDPSDPSKAYPYLNATNLELDQIDAVILSHAHLDHSGFIPYLYAYGYEGPVYCTPPTRDMMVLLQQDCINVMNSEGGKAPYSERDIKKELTHVITREYGEVTDVTSDVRFTFHNAGHMVGSAMIHLHIGEGLHNLIYSGDIKFGKTRVCDSASTVFPRAETFLLESTYGGRQDVKPRIEETEAKFCDMVRQTVDKGGKVLVPVIASGRAQEIMCVLEEYFKEPNFTVYIDGMSKEASAVHTAYPEYLRRTLQRRILQNDSPFEKPMFKTVQNSEHRKQIAESDEACVIVAPSGMLNGGPSLQFLKLLAHDAKNLLILVSYQSSMTIGRKLQQGDREIPIVDERATKQETLKVNMSVQSMEGFSGHSDRSQLLNFIRSVRPKPMRVLTMHGDNGKCEDLARTINKMLHVETRVPMNLDSTRLK